MHIAQTSHINSFIITKNNLKEKSYFLNTYKCLILKTKKTFGPRHVKIQIIINKSSITKINIILMILRVYLHKLEKVKTNLLTLELLS